MRLPERLSSLHRAFQALHAESVFFSAMICLPALVLQKSVAALWAQVCVLFVMALFQRGKIRLLPSVLLTICLCFFELCTPRGKIFFAMLTQDALRAGLRKSGTLVGMIFLSQAALSPHLRLHGTAGRFFASTLAICNALAQQQISFKRGNCIRILDEILLRTWHDCDFAQKNAPAVIRRHTALQKALPFLLTALMYAALILPVLHEGGA